MKPAYPIAYRDEIVETQGKLFGRFQREHPEADGEDFMSAYMRGETRARIDGAAAVLSNMTASELEDAFMRQDGYVIRPGCPTDPLAADWIGQFYAYYQWQTGEKSKDIIARIPAHVMCAAYPGLHDLDLPLAVERVAGMSARFRPVASKRRDMV